MKEDSLIRTLYKNYNRVYFSQFSNETVKTGFCTVHKNTQFLDITSSFSCLR